MEGPEGIRGVDPDRIWRLSREGPGGSREGPEWDQRESGGFQGGLGEVKRESGGVQSVQIELWGPEVSVGDSGQRGSRSKVKGP